MQPSVAHEPNATSIFDFFAQKMRHVLVLFVADGTVPKGEQDRSILQRLDILDLGIHCHGPERDIEVGIHIQDLLMDIDDGDLASATRAGPVHCKFRFAHAVTSITGSLVA
jgi:hypothetical protein